jgi:hypothetical protein
VPDPLRQELREAANRRDFVACNRATHKLFGLTCEEQSLIEGMKAKTDQDERAAGTGQWFDKQQVMNTVQTEEVRKIEAHHDLH